MLLRLFRLQKSSLSYGPKHSFGLFGFQNKEIEVNPNIPSHFHFYAQNVNNFNLEFAEKVFRTEQDHSSINSNIRFLLSKGYSKEMLSKINKENSKIFSSQISKMTIEQFYNFCSEELGLSESKIKRIIFKYPRIFNLTLEQFQEKISLLKTLKIKKKALNKIIVSNPLIFNQHLEKRLSAFERLFHDYARARKKQIGIIASKFPFFLGISPSTLKSHFHNLNKRQFSSSEIIELLNRNCDFLYCSIGSLDYMYRLFSSYNVRGKILNNMIMKYPKLLSQCPNQAFIKRFKVFLDNGFTKEQIGQFIREEPKVFIKSTASLELKFKYLKQRVFMDIKNDKIFPAILNLNYYETLRPRGELMMKQKVLLPWTDIMYLTDEEYAEKVGASLEELKELKQNKPATSEIDLKYRPYFKFTKISGKLMKI